MNAMNAMNDHPHAHPRDQVHVVHGPRDARAPGPWPGPWRLPTQAADRRLEMLRGHFMDVQMHAVLILDGHVDAQRLARAMSLLVWSEPILACRWVEGPLRPHWERRADLDEVPLCSLEQVAEDAVDDALTRFFAREPHPSVEPVIHLRIFRAQRDTLCIKIDHTVADARGLMACVYALVGLYNRLGEDPDHLPRPAPAKDRSCSQILRQMPSRVRLGVARRWWRDARSVRSPPGWWAFPTRPDFDPSQLRGKTYVRRQVPKQRIRAAKVFARSRGMTLNDVFIAAHLEALHAVIQPPAAWPLRLELMVDLRRYLRPDTSAPLANIAGRCFLSIEGGVGPSFEDLALRVHAQTARLKRDLIGTGTLLPTLLLGAAPQALGRVVMGLDRIGDELAMGELTPLLTNAGALDPTRLRLGELQTLDVYMNAGVVNPPYLATGLMSFGEAATLSTGFYASGFDPELVEELFERTIEALPAASAAEDPP